MKMDKKETRYVTTNYIYLLYAQEDYDRVLPYIKKLSEQFIVYHPQSDEPLPSIKNSLYKPTLLIYFVSNYSLYNNYCYDTAIFIRDSNISFVNIVLKGTNISSRFNADFSKYQMAYEEKFNNADELIDSLIRKTSIINETLLSRNRIIEKYIFHKLYVDTPEQYLTAVREGYCDIEIPEDQEGKLKALLFEYKDESGDTLFEYLKVMDYLESEDPNTFKELERLKNKGHVKGFYGLAQYYGYVLDDENKAKELFKIAADMGYGIAYFDLALFEKDAQSIIDLLEKSASYECFEAEMNLGELYFKCDSFYFDELKIEIDYKKAFYWCKRAASQGNDLAECYVGIMYLEGKGVNRSYQDAYEWFLKATKHKLQTPRQEAQYYLGLMYYYGYGVKKDYSKALYWFEKAKKRAIDKCGYYLGLMYYYGKGVEQSYQLALRHFEWSMDGKSCRFLGYMYYKGIYVAQSYKEASLYWKRGAEEDNADCAYYLAALYLTGKGVEQSKEKAIYWLEKASKLGHDKASELLKDIKED